MSSSFSEFLTSLHSPDATQIQARHETSKILGGTYAIAAGDADAAFLLPKLHTDTS